MGDSPIPAFYNDNQKLLDYLKRNNEVSFYFLLDSHFRKTLVLSIASYFEDQVTTILKDWVNSRSNEYIPLLEFVKNKAIKRQYHTYFQWDRSNANNFWGLFGKQFSDSIQMKIKSNKELDEAVKAFLEIGNLRNELVHENFVIYPMEKNSEEIFSLYQRAFLFLSFLREALLQIQ